MLRYFILTVFISAVFAWCDTPNGSYCFFGKTFRKCQDYKVVYEESCKYGCIDLQCYDPYCKRQSKLDIDKTGICKTYLINRSNDMVQSYLVYNKIINMVNDMVNDLVTKYDNTCKSLLYNFICNAMFPSCVHNDLYCLNLVDITSKYVGFNMINTCKKYLEYEYPKESKNSNMWFTIILLTSVCTIFLLIAIVLLVIKYRSDTKISI
jgi:hypothetical protein